MDLVSYEHNERKNVLHPQSSLHSGLYETDPSTLVTFDRQPQNSDCTDHDSTLYRT